MQRALLAMSFLAALASFPGCSCGNTIPATMCSSSAECGTGFECRDGRCRRIEMGRDTGTPEDCVDNDGDGFGTGTGCRGPDCNDADPIQNGAEICDGRDNDCDGVIDNGVLSACRSCDPECRAGESGVGTGDPFDLSMDENDGVTLDDEGAIILDSRSVNTHFIWIANTGAGQVVKLDTRSFAEVGRYHTDTDPSRTSVNSLGDVYVGNRAGYSLTKVDVRGDMTCPDTNGDGVITTSTGGGSVLAPGMDDCVLWTTELPPGGGIIRAVAAQDEFGPDGELRPYVWAGGWNGRVYKLDGITGAVILDTEAPVQPYGFAIDAAGNLWMSGLTGDMGRIDTNRCRDVASCSDPVCVGETAACDAAVKQRVHLPDVGYGITVDFEQRVWIAGSTIKRYDPMAAIGSRWAQTSPGYFCNGIGADAVGFVWAACEGNSNIVRIDTDNPSMWRAISTDANRGIGIDADGKVWGINRVSGRGTANVITPGPTLDDNPVMIDVGPSLSSPYTYSDMTGLQLRLATNPRGWYRTVYEGCDPAVSVETTWGLLDWEAEVPAGTRLTFRVRTAATIAELGTATWTVVATVPPDAPPVDVGMALDAAMVPQQRYLTVEVILEAERSSATEVITPRVLSVHQEWTCPPIFG